MLRLMSYILKQGKATQDAVFPPLEAGVRGMPRIEPGSQCAGADCAACRDVCPTNAIELSQPEGSAPRLSLDLGKCIACGLCTAVCPEGVIVNNVSTKTAARSRDALVLTNAAADIKPVDGTSLDIFRRDFAIRVVSTGCSACDLEIGAAFNPIFDMERFGIHLAASPRMADALVVTGPCGKGMHDALRRTYEAMADPRLVIAAGTCAISGGIHAGGYAEANGVSAILPVDVNIPGCPPHPWSIIYGLLLAMGRVTA